MLGMRRPSQESDTQTISPSSLSAPPLSSAAAQQGALGLSSMSDGPHRGGGGMHAYAYGRHAFADETDGMRSLPPMHAPYPSPHGPYEPILYGGGQPHADWAPPSSFASSGRGPTAYSFGSSHNRYAYPPPPPPAFEPHHPHAAGRGLSGMGAFFSPPRAHFPTQPYHAHGGGRSSHPSSYGQQRHQLPPTPQTAFDLLPPPAPSHAFQQHHPQASAPASPLGLHLGPRSDGRIEQPYSRAAAPPTMLLSPEDARFTRPLAHGPPPSSYQPPAPPSSYRPSLDHFAESQHAGYHSSFSPGGRGGNYGASDPPSSFPPPSGFGRSIYTSSPPQPHPSAGRQMDDPDPSPPRSTPSPFAWQGRDGRQQQPSLTQYTAEGDWHAPAVEDHPAAHHVGDGGSSQERGSQAFGLTPPVTAQLASRQPPSTTTTAADLAPMPALSTSARPARSRKTASATQKTAVARLAKPNPFAPSSDSQTAAGLPGGDISRAPPVLADRSTAQISPESPVVAQVAPPPALPNAHAPDAPPAVKRERKPDVSSPAKVATKAPATGKKVSSSSALATKKAKGKSVGGEGSSGTRRAQCARACSRCVLPWPSSLAWAQKLTVMVRSPPLQVPAPAQAMRQRRQPALHALHQDDRQGAGDGRVPVSRRRPPRSLTSPVTRADPSPLLQRDSTRSPRKGGPVPLPAETTPADVDSASPSLSALCLRISSLTRPLPRAPFPVEGDHPTGSACSSALTSPTSSPAPTRPTTPRLAPRGKPSPPTQPKRKSKSTARSEPKKEAVGYGVPSPPTGVASTSHRSLRVTLRPPAPSGPSPFGPPDPSPFGPPDPYHGYSTRGNRGLPP